MKEPPSYGWTMPAESSGHGKIPAPRADSPFHLPPPSNKALAAPASCTSLVLRSSPYRGLSGALRRCMAVNKMPPAEVATVHHAPKNRETTPSTIQKTMKRPQNRFDGSPLLSRAPSSLTT